MDAATIRTGRPSTPVPRVLRAGPVLVDLDGADLRSVRVGDGELVQRVYMAVRDAPWNTIPGEFADWSVDEDDDSFLVTFTARHAHEAIDLRWAGRIQGLPDGTIRYELDGICHGVFEYSKIGFNVHHALDGSVGHRYRIVDAEGRTRDGVLPEAIDPQRIVDTPMQDTVLEAVAPFRGLTPDELSSARLKTVPLGRSASAEECAGVIWFLLSDAAAYMTGQGINFTGGLVML